MRKLVITAAAMCLTTLLSAPSFAATAVFAGGCFWCVEKDFEHLEGVSDVVSGFTGGALTNPTYNGDHAGHFEAVKITYDPAVVSYEQLLDHFWVNHDPFDAVGQFCDKGAEYLSAIFVANDTEHALATASLRAIEERFPNQAVVTPVLVAGVFYPIAGNESYHQDYYKKSPLRYKAYRYACGRDKRLRAIWGDDATV